MMLKRPTKIATLLAALSIGPAVLMSLVLGVWLYFSRMYEVERDIAGRGQLFAETLAEGARYGVVSGDMAALNDALQSVLQSQPSIARVEVFDANHKLLGAAGIASTKGRSFEAPIALRHLPIDVDAGLPAGPVQRSAGASTSTTSGSTVGVALVYVTTEPFKRAAVQSLLVAGLFVLTIALLTGLASSRLARRVRDPLREIMATVRGLRSGHLAPVLARGAVGELDQLQSAIEEMCAELHAARVDLEMQVAARTAELQEAVDAARWANEERSQLIARSHHQLEEERHRIARELHDELGSMVVALRLRSQHIEFLAKGEKGIDHLAEIAQQAADVAEGLNTLYLNARGLVEQLRPEALDAFGLHVAISAMIRSFDTLHSDCHFSVAASDSFPEVRGPEAIVAYRVVQEALTNVVRHSRATRCRVKLEIDEGRLRITVSDNGGGFDPDVAGRGRLGLLGMRERVAAIGGGMTITSDRRGSLLQFDIPLSTTT